jgi:hypothetical protein
MITSAVRSKSSRTAYQVLAALALLSSIRSSVAAAPATSLVLTLDHCAVEACPPTSPVRPPVVSSGETFSIFAIAVDSTGRDLSYRGTISFSSSDPAAELPLPYTFAASDNGGRGFAVVLRSVGQQTIFVSDLNGNLIPGSLTLTVIGTTSPISVPTLTESMQVAFALLLVSAGVWSCRRL